MTQEKTGDVSKLLSDVNGVDVVLSQTEMEQHGIRHSRSGELLAISKEGHWFAYPYWLTENSAPDFQHCVAIHAKPGWDPSELFLRPGWGGRLHLAKRILQSKLSIRAPFDVISGDANDVHGAHGRIPTSDVTRPVLITSWDQESAELLPMRDVKSILVTHMRQQSR